MDAHTLRHFRLFLSVRICFSFVTLHTFNLKVFWKTRFVNFNTMLTNCCIIWCAVSAHAESKSLPVIIFFSLVIFVFFFVDKNNDQRSKWPVYKCPYFYSTKMDLLDRVEHYSRIHTWNYFVIVSHFYSVIPRNMKIKQDSRFICSSAVWVFFFRIWESNNRAIFKMCL